MGRTYQNERLLMKEVGLISDFKLVVTTQVEVDFEGTDKEVDMFSDELMQQEDVVHIGVYKHI